MRCDHSQDKRIDWVRGPIGRRGWLRPPEPVEPGPVSCQRRAKDFNSLPVRWENTKLKSPYPSSLKPRYIYEKILKTTQILHTFWAWAALTL